MAFYTEKNRSELDLKDSTTFYLEIDDNEFETYDDIDNMDLLYECPVCQSYNCLVHNHREENYQYEPIPPSTHQAFLNNNNILDTLKGLEFNNNFNSNYLLMNYKKWLINLSPIH